MTAGPASLDGERVRHLLPGPLGAALRAARVRHGWGLRPAARNVGISASYLCQLELGQRCPSTAVALALISALGLEDDVAGQLLDVARPASGRSWYAAPGVIGANE